MVGLVVGIVYFWDNGVSWPQIILMTLMYIATGMGITVGYHRLFTHKSFSAGPVVTMALGILGSMAAEGSILRWCAAHRRHHQFSDHDGDPHSPHLHGHDHGIRGIISGFWHAHMGWIFDPPGEALDRYVPDLIRDRKVRAISTFFPLWVGLGFVIPAVLGGLLNLAIGALGDGVRARLELVRVARRARRVLGGVTLRVVVARSARSRLRWGRGECTLTVRTS